MSPDELEWVRATMGAQKASRGERVQSLWGGYGEIVRVPLTGAVGVGIPVPSVIVKRVAPGAGRGLSHERKLRSYAVEERWYARWAARCSAGCRLPRAHAAERTAHGWRFLLEDLDAAGFGGRRRAVRGAELDACLDWLARFHATFVGDVGRGEAPDGLWPTGSYWHLATRPDELAVIRDPALRDAAAALDARLAAARYRTVVHGDPKPANFCFASEARADAPVAAVDFQYVGGGCGMRDVAYLLFAAHGWGGPPPDVDAALDRYFATLREALQENLREALQENLREALGGVDGDDLEREWRALYPVAAADFHRFLAGWSPGPDTLAGYRRALDAI